jgi:hypothetical protein
VGLVGLFSLHATFASSEQTGLLYAMYVDKLRSGIKALQMLSG